MKIIILTSKLKDGLSSVERAVTESGSLPVLKNVHIHASGNKVNLSTTNLELGIVKSVFGKVVDEGIVVVPFQTLYKIISNSDSEKVNLEASKNKLTITTDNYNATVQGISPDEFPIIPSVKNQSHKLEINFSSLKDALLQVSPAAQISEIRPEISGVFIDHQLTITKCTATDTFRLAEKTLSDREVKTTFSQGFSAIVPIKTIQEVLRIFPDKEPVDVFVDDNQVLFKNGETELISRLIDGDYPDYEAIIPKTIESEIIVDRVQFINALKLVSSFSSKVHEVQVKLLDNKKTIEVYAGSQDVGENRYLIPVKFKGDSFDTVSFNWRYLLDGLKVVQGENIFFGINGDTKPSIMKSPADTTYFYIIMPIKA